MQERQDTEELQELRNAAEKAIREHESERVISFIWNSRKYWIKRKLGNGRNQLVKYSVEKEFYYEIARRTIAKNACPDLVPDMPVLTPDYMVIEDGGMTVKSWLDQDIPEEEKREILRRAGTALCRLHRAGIVHGRPALRDITAGTAGFPSWTGKTGFTATIQRNRKPSIFCFSCRPSIGKTIPRKRNGLKLQKADMWMPAVVKCGRMPEHIWKNTES